MDYSECDSDEFDEFCHSSEEEKCTKDYLSKTTCWSKNFVNGCSIYEP